MYRKFLAFIDSSFIDSTEALEFAQAKLSPFGKEHKYIERLEVRFRFA